MLARLSVWVMAAALGQQPASEPAWLKAVPADVDVVIRSRGLDATRHDVLAMLKAMSPALAAQADPGLTDLLAGVPGGNGGRLAKSPWVGLIRTGAPGGGAAVSYALMILGEDAPGVLKELAGGVEVAFKPQDGELGSFPSPAGDGNWYAAKGPGFVTVGPDRGLVLAVGVAKPGAKTLDRVLTADLAGPFLAGDLGVYANVAALATRHADVIEQTRQTFLAAVEQAAQQQGNPASVKVTRQIYTNLFDSLKHANLLTLGFDFAGEALKLGGVLDVKPGTDLAKGIAAGRAGDAADLGKFGADAAAYAYFNMDAKDFQRMQGLGFRMLNPEDKSTPALDRAMAAFRELGSVEAAGESSFQGGMRSLNVITTADPAKYLDAANGMLSAMKDSQGPLNFYKDVQVTKEAETYRGFAFDRVVATLDLDKMSKLGGQNKAAVANVKAMFGGEVVTYWIGTDGKRVIQATTPTWKDAQARIDAFLDGKAGIGATPGFQAVRRALPDRASFLMLFDAQGMLPLFASQLGPQGKLPDDLPKEPALVGVSLTPRPPTQYEFHLVVSSPVGPVIEKGFAPLIQNLRPKQ